MVIRVFLTKKSVSQVSCSVIWMWESASRMWESASSWGVEFWGYAFCTFINIWSKLKNSDSNYTSLKTYKKNDNSMANPRPYQKGGNLKPVNKHVWCSLTICLRTRWAALVSQWICDLIQQRLNMWPHPTKVEYVNSATRMMKFLLSHLGHSPTIKEGISRQIKEPTFLSRAYRKINLATSTLIV